MDNETKQETTAPRPAGDAAPEPTDARLADMRLVEDFENAALNFRVPVKFGIDVVRKVAYDEARTALLAALAARDATIRELKTHNKQLFEAWEQTRLDAERLTKLQDLLARDYTVRVWSEQSSGARQFFVLVSPGCFWPEKHDHTNLRDAIDAAPEGR